MTPGWYQDPFSSAGYVRWWDGSKWGPSVLLPDGMQVGAPGVPVPLPPPGSAPVDQSGPGPAAPTPTSAASPPPPPPAPPAGWAPPPGPGSAPNPYGAPAYGTPGYAPPPYGGDPWSAGSPYRLASWGSRAGARILDLVIELAIATPFLLIILGPAIGRAIDAIDETGTLSGDALQRYIEDVTASSLAVTVVGLVVGLLYEVPQNRFFGRTLGKRALGIRIRPRDEDVRLSWGQCLVRWATESVPAAFVGAYVFVDYLWPFWDKPWRQALHDKAARTTVVPIR